jgi:hypothetical protein
MSDFVVATSVTNYPGVGDGFNKFRGVAPSCKWAGAKVFTDAGASTSTVIGSAIDELVSLRAADNIKIMNLSLGLGGDPGTDTALRQKVNTAVNNGIVMCISAGNDGVLGAAGQREIDDPGRAGLALTVAGASDVNRLTDYTSVGFTDPGASEGQDYKPDLMAPGGSFYYTSIMAADSNTGDSASFTDQRANDYYNVQGTSMASPFAAGCAALVIDALQQKGITWDFTSGQHSKYVKMVLCATATESNANRESGVRNPTLQRATSEGGFPDGKDRYEGYGMINADAAVEAVYLAYFHGSIVSDTLGANFNDCRAWARTVSLRAGVQFAPSLAVPAAGDFDLYLYSSTPSTYGTPVILASSTHASVGAEESLAYTPSAAATAILVVKRVSGSGAFTLNTPVLPGDYNRDGHVDGQDLPHFMSCGLGPHISQPDPNCGNADFDHDGDVDTADFGVWQRCYTGPAAPINPNCAN